MFDYKPLGTSDLTSELDHLQRSASRSVPTVPMSVLNKPPAKVKDGNLYNADGSNWNPTGQGGGLHRYDAASGKYKRLEPYTGTAALVAGSVTVSNATVTANSRIYVTCQSPGGTPGALRIDSRVAGTSFTIKSSSATDTSTVAWSLIEP